MSDASIRHPPLRLVTHALPQVLFVPSFYAEDLGVPLAAVGLAIAAWRLLDVVTDPLIGVASDRLGFVWVPVVASDGSGNVAQAWLHELASRLPLKGSRQPARVCVQGALVKVRSPPYGSTRREKRETPLPAQRLQR